MDNMSKWLKVGINVVVILANFIIVAASVGFLWPIGYLYWGVKGNVARSVWANESFLRYSGSHRPTASTIASFPNWPYVLLMAIGGAIMMGAAIWFCLTLRKLLKNLAAADYFSMANVELVRKLVYAECYMVLSNSLIAGGNQITSTWLDGYNNGVLAQTWSDVADSLVGVVVLEVIYVMYSRAMAIKTENDLTV